ncbi:hypothetical protein CEXT_136311 [Caerostris extrusa]|uniref:Uncharacterized protein n=1 Tax=Caerostris extrusa TaxID=172846 RepID=A0AAV4SJE4_CAEEX|nr:hypothetical protein CEXT_136311 [Caerostris extrusa]
MWNKLSLSLSCLIIKRTDTRHSNREMAENNNDDDNKSYKNEELTCLKRAEKAFLMKYFLLKNVFKIMEEKISSAALRASQSKELTFATRIGKWEKNNNDDDDDNNNKSYEDEKLSCLKRAERLPNEMIRIWA